MLWMRPTGSSALALAACLIAAPASAETLRFAASGDAASLDPYAYYTTFTSGFLQNVYEPLVRYDETLNFEPALAVSWERTAPTTWRFKLREGVTFHNGNPFTADDVVASLNRARDENSPYIVATSAISDVEKIDDHTVDIHLDGPYPVLLNDLAGVLILDKEWMEANDTLRPVNPSKGEESYATTNANGTGPFMIESRRPDAETVFVANPDWWDEPEHNLDKVIFTPITSSATRVAALLSGEVDLIMEAPLHDLARIERADNLQVLKGEDLRVMFLGLNQGSPELNSSSVKGENPLADVRVRQAIYQAINIDALNEKVMRGLAKPTGILVAKEIQGYDAELAPRAAPYDVDAARALLAEAGYPDGFDVGMDCPNDRYVNPDQVCQAIAAMLAKVGVDVNYTSSTKSIYFNKMLSGGADIYLFGWASTPQLDAYALLNSVMHSKSGKQRGKWNPGGYENARLDELVEKIQVEIDMDKRQEMISEAFRLHKEDYGTIALYQQPLTWAAKKEVEALQLADNKIRLWWVTKN
ncbi:ABC transporter substrate-binding protein [Pikeienuella sp. HZG-20]|uniref:ABC transporter substrate-binding protein n=1 Tax=Paludibacillus litoralis TaxID=3133267 RepID=UPI0030EF5C40